MVQQTYASSGVPYTKMMMRFTQSHHSFTQKVQHWCDTTSHSNMGVVAPCGITPKSMLHWVWGARCQVGRRTPTLLLRQWSKQEVLVALNEAQRAVPAAEVVVGRIGVAAVQGWEGVKETASSVRGPLVQASSILLVSQGLKIIHCLHNSHINYHSLITYFFNLEKIFSELPFDGF